MSLVAGQFFCSGVCHQINCAAAAQVSQVYPPVLAYSTAATNLLGSKTVLYVQYGSPVPLNLQPCSALGEPRSLPLQRMCSRLHLDQRNLCKQTYSVTSYTADALAA